MISLFYFRSPICYAIKLLLYISKAKSLKYTQISLTTNGRMLSYQYYCKQIIKNGINEIIISVHGHSAKVHDSLSKVKGSFEQTIEGIKNISKLRNYYNIKLIISVTLNKINYIYFGDIIDLFFGFNISEITFNIVQPLGSLMEKYFFSLMPKYSEVSKFIENYYINNKSKFYKTIKNYNFRIISIIDMPFCQSEEINDYLGYGEKRVIEDVVKIENVYINKMQKIEFDDNKKLKIKRDLCNKCIYNNLCNGIYSNYTKNFLIGK